MTQRHIVLDHWLEGYMLSPHECTRVSDIYPRAGDAPNRGSWRPLPCPITRHHVATRTLVYSGLDAQLPDYLCITLQSPLRLNQSQPFDLLIEQPGFNFTILIIK